MPRYEYRNLAPTPDAQKTFLGWIDWLDSQFKNPEPEHRSIVVREALHQLYLGKPYSAPEGDFAQRALVAVGSDGIVRWSFQADSPAELPPVELLREGVAALTADRPPAPA